MELVKYLFLGHLQRSIHKNSEDLAILILEFDDVSVKTIYRYRGKYLLRKIPHASHGSFNPYVITNKEAHIINGKI